MVRVVDCLGRTRGPCRNTCRQPPAPRIPAIQPGVRCPPLRDAAGTGPVAGCSWQRTRSSNPRSLAGKLPAARRDAATGRHAGARAWRVPRWPAASQPRRRGGPADRDRRSRRRPAGDIRRARRAHTVSIVDSRHLVIRNLVLDGRNLPVDGVKAEGHARWAHHITLENLVIRGHGNNQQTVAISTKCPAWNWVIRDNTIVGAGTGIYLGNSDGRAPFVAGLIERNLIVDSSATTCRSSTSSRVRRSPACRRARSVTDHPAQRLRQIRGRHGGGAAAQPAGGTLPAAGAAPTTTYAIYGNFFYQNRLEALFQGEGNVAFYGNVLVNDWRRASTSSRTTTFRGASTSRSIPCSRGTRESRSCRRRGRRHSPIRWLPTSCSPVSPSPAASSCAISRHRSRTPGSG